MTNNNQNESGLKFVLRAFRNRNYRIFFVGQGASLVGTWMQQMAMSWLVYRLTNSPFLLGMIGFLGQVPTFLLAPLAGVIADRHNRHRLLVIVNILSMLQAAVLAWLFFTHNLQIWHILALSVFVGMVNAFEIPTRHSFTFELVEHKEDLGNAIALNSSMFNIARLIGPSIAGIMISVAGEGWCFTLNALSFLAVIGALLLMRGLGSRPKNNDNDIWRDLKVGFVYAFNHKLIRNVLLLLSFITLMGVPFQVLMPVYAKDIFHGDSRTLGFLWAMAGVGALTGTLYLAGRGNAMGLLPIVTSSTVIFSVSIIAFSFCSIFWLTMAIIGVAAFYMMVNMAASNTILQTVVDEDKRGRVMSFFTMSFMGTAPFGSLIAGVVAEKIGGPWTLLVTGIICLIGAVIFQKVITDKPISDSLKA
ncbi:MAG: MFS transporter [Candidatus Omnitrophica bacterium]|nr:MFS transporter [Candidatus Omnitrophota bacterium]